jgi:hypothetical protein
MALSRPADHSDIFSPLKNGCVAPRLAPQRTSAQNTHADMHSKSLSTKVSRRKEVDERQRAPERSAGYVRHQYFAAVLR